MNAFFPKFAATAAALCLAPALHAAVVFQEAFPGTSASNLDGTTPGTVSGSIGTWKASTLFKADGSVATAGSGDDRGAALNLGAGFFQANSLYTLTLDVATQGANIGIYAGFTTTTYAAFDPNARAQTQGTSYSIELRPVSFGNTGPYISVTGAATQPTPVDNPSLAAGAYTLTLDTTAGVNNATLQLFRPGDVAAYATLGSVNLSGMQTFFLGVEGNAASQSFDLNSVSLQVVPEPSAVLSGCLGLALLLRRRR